MSRNQVRIKNQELSIENNSQPRHSGARPQSFLDQANWKNDFPIFTHHPNLVYLDSAATSQKPESVINAVSNFYTHTNANVHRGIYDLSVEATKIYESTRDKAATFIGAKNSNEVVFTGNASEAINLVAYGWARKNLKALDIIVTSVMEHHSNIVPWLRLKEELGVEVIFLPLDNDFRLDYTSLASLPIDHKRIKLIALSHASNVLGTINQISRITNWLKSNDIHAKVLIDAAQSIAHIPVNVTTLDCDFLVFSGHKVLAPTGIGLLWAKTELLEDMEPLFGGSHMISRVTQQKATWADIPHKFEVGTGKLEAVAGLGAAIDYLNTIGYEKLAIYEEYITTYFLAAASRFQGITLYGPHTAGDRLAVFSFTIQGAHPHDIAEILNRKHIAIRSGHHCAQPLMDVLGIPATARASLYMYNTTEDIDALFQELEKVKTILKLRY